MHVLKTYSEKLVDVKQQVRTAQVMLLGDASQGGGSLKKRNTTTATSHPDNNQDLLQRQPSNIQGMMTEHKLTPQCCQCQHFLPPEGDPVYQPDRRQCGQFNRMLMRSIVEGKMRKNKSFFELKILPNADLQHTPHKVLVKA
jgi:hypothetical protein